MKKIYKILILYIAVFALGFGAGKLYESRNQDLVYIFNQARFIKLVALSVAIENPNDDRAAKESLDQSMRRLKLLLDKDYSNHPILVTAPQGNRSQGYGFYKEGRQTDITEDLIIKIIGEDRWKEIGKIFLK